MSFFDLWAEIKTQCQGEFATLTPDAFVQKWQTALQVSPQSGYQVVYNSVSVQKPCFSSIFADKKPIKGGVIDGQCVVRATQEQKYHEVVQCAFGQDYPQRKRFHLKVPLTHYDETQFFETPTGKLWFERAYAIAHNYFLACNRQTRITVEAALPVDSIAKLTMDTQVRVGHRFAGKIVDYRIKETAAGRLCRLVLCEACSVEPLKIPTLPVSKTEKAPGVSFVQDLDCQNLFSAQNAYALSHKEGALKLPVTTVYLQLRDLTSQLTEPRIYQV